MASAEFPSVTRGIGSGLLFDHHKRASARNQARGSPGSASSMRTGEKPGGGTTSWADAITFQQSSTLRLVKILVLLSTRLKMAGLEEIRSLNVRGWNSDCFGVISSMTSPWSDSVLAAEYRLDAADVSWGTTVASRPLREVNCCEVHFERHIPVVRSMRRFLMMTTD